MPVELESRERRVVGFLERFWIKFGHAPSYHEIMIGGQLSSKDQVSRVLAKLEDKGYISRKHGLARSIRLLRTVSGEPVRSADRHGAQVLHVPLLGKIAAGQPIHWPTSGFEPYDHEMIELTGSMVGRRDEVYALKVQGDSMMDAMIMDGDIVVMEPYAEMPVNGEIVAAWLPAVEETTLKRYYLEGEMVRLQPCNQSMAPFFMSRDAVEVQGRLVAVIRQVC